MCVFLAQWKCVYVAHGLEVFRVGRGLEQQDKRCLCRCVRMAGNFRGNKGAAKTYTPVDLWNVEIKTLNKPFELDLPDGHNCVVFVRSGRRLWVCVRASGSHAMRCQAYICARAGRLRVGDEGAEKDLGPAATALMKKEGTTLRIVAAAPDTKVLILAGQPLNEPIAAQVCMCVCQGLVTVCCALSADSLGCRVASAR